MLRLFRTVAVLAREKCHYPFVFVGENLPYIFMLAFIKSPTFTTCPCTLSKYPGTAIDLRTSREGVVVAYRRAEKTSTHQKLSI